MRLTAKYNEMVSNPYALAAMAGTPSPDSFKSPGAGYLKDVAHAVTEALEDGDIDVTAADSEDGVHEVVDAILEGRSTHYLMQAGVDLCAYDEDITDYGYHAGRGSMVKNMTLGLYLIGVRLGVSVVEEFAEMLFDLDAGEV